jgi:hypothetical protein
VSTKPGQLHKLSTDVAGTFTLAYRAGVVEGPSRRRAEPWHSGHSPEPSQALQATARERRNHHRRLVSETPEPPHLPQLPLPAQNGQAPFVPRAMKTYLDPPATPFRLLYPRRRAVTVGTYSTGAGSEVGDRSVLLP